MGSNPTPSTFWKEPFPAAVLTRQNLTLPAHEKPLGEGVDAVIALLEARGILTC